MEEQNRVLHSASQLPKMIKIWSYEKTVNCFEKLGYLKMHEKGADLTPKACTVKWVKLLGSEQRK